MRTLRTASGARSCLLGLTAASATALALGFVHPPASYDPTLRAAMETVIVLCALGGTWLLRGQWRGRAGCVELASEMREHVVRIAREAIANAARHGQAEHVSVTLNHEGTGVVLRVRDDGCGFAHALPAAAGGGFGLRSMRDRAAARRGHLIVTEPKEGGTELEVLLR